MHTRSLHGILLGAIAASVSACSSGSTSAIPPEGGTSTDGDGGTTPTTTVNTGGELTSPFDCSMQMTAYEAVRVATKSDYLELRRVTLSSDPDAGAAIIAQQVAVGTKCGNATNPAMCNSALDALTSSTFLFNSCGGCPGGGSYLAFTKGDQVGKVAMGELAGFLGTIDAPAKAWLDVTAKSYSPKCGAGWIRETTDGYVILATKELSDCPIQTQDVALHVGRDGTITVLDSHDNPASNACVGRRPAGLVAETCRKMGVPRVGRHFAKIARLEAASVDAFYILRDELAAHGAPRRLLLAAERAARDEVRHARAMARIAKRHGAVVEDARVVRSPVRSLVDIATENAVEGCVRETYGALEGMWQARAASDAAIRAAMKPIAADETRHGALSWSIAAWLDTKLTPEERARVRAARDAEVARITESLRAEPAADLVEVAGVPNAAQATALAAHLQATLWAA